LPDAPSPSLRLDVLLSELLPLSELPLLPLVLLPAAL
jgi:hypothetical protein